ncbi:flavodoxin family protein [Thalassotalea euphylliae]|uniref:flavodoxin family protein n=1 Tax=Thalassotalea euphylliae TaxID=1655234 RepID=UPI00364118D9
MKIAIILGSSRPAGNTAHFVSELCKCTQHHMKVFDLTDYRVEPFDYDYKNQDDDFMPLMREIISDYEIILFASPVYWYSPSAQLKAFLDRLSDLLDIDKPLGRSLKGKYAGVIATGVQENSPSCFEEIFKLTFSYLHLNYIGLQYCTYVDEKAELSDIAEQSLQLRNRLLEVEHNFEENTQYA